MPRFLINFMKISKEIKAGIIAIIAIVSFVLLFQFMKGRSVFSTDNAFYAKFDNVDGLQQSSRLSINGLKIGQVDRIIPVTDKNGKISFVVKVLADNQFEFSKNSTLEIFESGLMSGTEIRINPVYGAPYAKDGDTLKSNFELSMMKSLGGKVEPVADQLQSALKTIDSLSANLNKVVDDQNRAEIKALLSNLNRTVASFEQTSRYTNAMISGSNPKLQSVLDNANVATISAKNAMDKYGKVAENIDVDKLNNAVDKLSITAEQLNNVISGIQRGEGSLGKLTKDEQLYHNLTKTSENLNALIEDLKANPKKYINISVFGKK